jgi:phosphatidylinositol alpha-1,6-mannosyltransferase
VSHLLVTNDFPPKVGGIQSYLWELWRRLPAQRVHVLTTPHAGAAAFDAEQPYPIERVRAPVLLPFDPAIRRAIRQTDPDLVVLDPALPLGLAGRGLRRPYALVVHGAEVTVPGRLPGGRGALARVLRGAAHVVAAGGYPELEVHRIAGAAAPPTTNIPPGVDTARFRPLDGDERDRARAALGLAVDGPLVLSVSRLVPRKGMDVLIEAFARVRASFPAATLAIAGAGRDRRRLDGVAARTGVDVRFLGRVPDTDLAALYGCADVFAMLCRDRWGGLEQEGFGIVFLEAAACGVPSVAGSSGGAADAVVDGGTGFVVGQPRDVDAVARALTALLDDDDRRRAMGEAARRRARAEFDYDVLAARLDSLLVGLET